MENEQPTGKPTAEVRLGNIRAAIWESAADGNTWYSATFERLYKDGDAWKSSTSFGRDDLLVVAKVADQAHSKIHELKGA